MSLRKGKTANSGTPSERAGAFTSETIPEEAGRRLDRMLSDFKIKRMSRARSRPSPIARGVSPKAEEQALSLIRQSMPTVAEATRIVTNREALADEIHDYRAQD